MSHVAWLVCLCGYLCVGLFGYTCELCKNGWNDRDAVWGLTHVCPKNQVPDGDKKVRFWGGPVVMYLRMNALRPLRANVPVHAAHTADECIRHRWGWKVENDEAASCEITWYICSWWVWRISVPINCALKLIAHSYWRRDSLRGQGSILRHTATAHQRHRPRGRWKGYSCGFELRP